MADATVVDLDLSGSMDVTLNPTKATLHNKLFGFLPTQLPEPKQWLHDRHQHVRPWLEFIQTSNFRAPPSLPRLSKRIMRNIEYFQSNYLYVFLGLIVYCLITSPLVLVALAASLYAGYRLNARRLRHPDRKLVVWGRELTLAQQYGVVAVCSMPVYYLVGAHAAVFWVLAASFIVITLHASFYNIDAVAAAARDGDDQFALLEQV